MCPILGDLIEGIYDPEMGCAAEHETLCSTVEIVCEHVHCDPVMKDILLDSAKQMYFERSINMMGKHNMNR